MLKKLISVLLIASLCLGIMPSAFANEQPISVELNGNLIQFDTEPVIINDRVMVPIRAIIEAVGAKVDWDGDSQKVTAVLGTTNVSFVIGEEKALKNGTLVDMYGGAVLIGGRSLVSARFVGEAFGLDVNWDEAARKVIIAKPKIEDLGKAYNIVSITADAQVGNPAVNVNDGDYYTRWSHDAYPAELVLELEDVVPIGYAGIACYLGDERQTQVSFDVSADGTNWTEVVPMTMTTQTLSMEPISFGEGCMAKYVRLKGYGNTNNEWNSITELKVYAPQADGSMPVDMNGPASTPKASLDTMDPEVKAALGKIDALLVDFPTWLAHMYDPETGGFYMAASAKDDPTMAPSLEVTSRAIQLITLLTNAKWKDIPPEVEQGLENFFLSRQNPETGWFEDVQAKGLNINERDIVRTNTEALGSLSRLKVDPIYPHPLNAQSDENGEEETSVTDTKANLPAYLSSPEAYRSYLLGLDWSYSWTAGDTATVSLDSLTALPEASRQQYVDVWFDTMESLQDPDTGLWCGEVNFVNVSGTFKMTPGYTRYSRPIPYVENIIDSVFECYVNYPASSSYYVRNPLSLLNRIIKLHPEFADEIRSRVVENIELIAGSFSKFLCPDGGFSGYDKRSLAKYGGITTTHGLYEGDMDGVLMIYNARYELYSLFGVSAPLVDAPDFWDWISGKKELPPLYKDEALASGNSVTMKLDFEQFDPNAEYDGSEFGGSEVNAALKVSVEKDVDRRDNKVLKLSYDGSASAGPSITLSGDGGQVRYIPYTKTVAEFKVKFANNTGSNNFYIDFGASPIAYALSFGGNGGQKMGVRVSTSSVNYGGAITTLTPNEWYNIRVEYEVNDDLTDATAKIYIDGELVSKNNSYFGVNTGALPTRMQPKMMLYCYKAGTGDVYFDDINMYTE